MQIYTCLEFLSENYLSFYRNANFTLYRDRRDWILHKRRSNSTMTSTIKERSDQHSWNIRHQRRYEFSPQLTFYFFTFCFYFYNFLFIQDAKMLHKNIIFISSVTWQFWIISQKFYYFKYSARNLHRLICCHRVKCLPLNLYSFIFSVARKFSIIFLICF